MSSVALIEAHDAFEHVKNNGALLICAYESDEKFHKLHLDGAIPLSEFQSLSDTMTKDKELIFY
ncbi:MAG: ArsR family transcriptional regulator [Desulfocapsaceae bacterium]